MLGIGWECGVWFFGRVGQAKGCVEVVCGAREARSRATWRQSGARTARNRTCACTPTHTHDDTLTRLTRPHARTRPSRILGRGRRRHTMPLVTNSSRPPDRRPRKWRIPASPSCAVSAPHSVPSAAVPAVWKDYSPSACSSRLYAECPHLWGAIRVAGMTCSRVTTAGRSSVCAAEPPTVLLERPLAGSSAEAGISQWRAWL